MHGDDGGMLYGASMAMICGHACLHAAACGHACCWLIAITARAAPRSHQARGQ
eukprot:SAG31_NODE_19494_length_600_cov_0.944112_1_plen_52_part_10